MIRFLKEDTSSELTRHIPWRLPDGIRGHLEKTLEDNKDESLTKNHTTKEALDHLKDILDMDNVGGIKFSEMKRMKNWFEKHSNAKKTKQYELYGGDVMMNWVNNQLNTARKTAEEHRKARKAAGYKNAYKKEHDADTQTTVTVADNRTPSYNPVTNNKKNRLKELSAIREHRTVVISEEQMRLIDSVQLNEIKLNDKWKIERERGKTHLNYKAYAEICSLDPTVRVVNNNRMTGKYCNWLLQRFDIQRIDDRNYKQRIRIALEQYDDGAKRGILKRNNINTDIGKFHSVEELVSAMRGIMGGGMQLSQSATNNMGKLNGQYEIVAESENWFVVSPKTFEAERYFGGGTEWCTVGNESYFDSYIKRGPLYITLHKSMDNNLKMQFHFESKSFADYSDNVVGNPKQCIYNVLGDSSDFYDVCDMWNRLSDSFRTYRFITVTEAEKMLSDGDDPRGIFEKVEDFKDGMAQVKLNGKYNFINQNMEFVWKKPFKEWFDFVYPSSNGWAVVDFDNKYNFIRQDGTLLWDKPVKEWFDEVSGFENGLSVVVIDGKHNYVRHDMELVWKMPVEEWFDEVSHFNNGLCRVMMGGGIFSDDKYNFIRQDGTLLWDKPVKEWFDDATEFENGVSLVEIGKKFNYIKQDGELVWNKPVGEWFDELNDFCYGLARVYVNGSYNFTDINGELLSDRGFDDADDFDNGFARVVVKGKWNLINVDNEQVSDTWFDGIGNFRQGFAMVILDDKINFINQEGVYLWRKPFEEWFDVAWDFDDGFARVGVDEEKYNFLKMDGNLLWNKPIEDWFDSVGQFYDYYGFASVELNNQRYFIDNSGILYNPTTRQPITDNRQSVDESVRMHI